MEIVRIKIVPSTCSQIFKVMTTDSKIDGGDWEGWDKKDYMNELTNSKYGIC